MIGATARQHDISHEEALRRLGLAGIPSGSPLTPPQMPGDSSGFAAAAPVPPPMSKWPGMFGSRPSAPIMTLGGDTETLGNEPIKALGTPELGADLGNMPALPSAPTLKPRFFDKGGLGQQIAGILGPALLAGGGRPDLGMQFLLSQQRLRADEQQRTRDNAYRQSQADWQRKKDMRPEIRSAGRSVVSVPWEGAPSVLYSDPTEAERYAAGLGYQPGTGDYYTALNDYVLRGNGPTAFGFDQQLEDQRQANRTSLEGVRQNNRLSLRGSPTYRDLHSAPAHSGSSGSAARLPRSVNEAVAPVVSKMARGEALTPGEQSVLDVYNSRGGRGGASGAASRPSGTPQGRYPIGQTATGPNGKRVRWNGSRWVPVR